MAFHGRMKCHVTSHQVQTCFCPFGGPICFKLLSQSLISSLSAELSETPTLEHDTFKIRLTVQRHNLSEAFPDLPSYLFRSLGRDYTRGSATIFAAFVENTSRKPIRHGVFKLSVTQLKKLTWNALPCGSRTVPRRSVSPPAKGLCASMPHVHVLFTTLRMPARTGQESGSSSSCSVARFCKGNIGLSSASVLPEHPLRRFISVVHLKNVSCGVPVN